MKIFWRVSHDVSNEEYGDQANGEGVFLRRVDGRGSSQPGLHLLHLSDHLLTQSVDVLVPFDLVSLSNGCIFDFRRFLPRLGGDGLRQLCGQ